MRYPKLYELNTSREMINVFKGYNHNLRIAENEFYDMTNLSSDNYPILSTRPKRGVYGPTVKPQGIVAKDTFWYIDNGWFIRKKDKEKEEEKEEEEKVNLKLTEEKDKDGKIIPKTLISMGAYVIILPDKKYINTVNITDYGNIDEIVETTTSVTFELCSVDGVKYNNTEKGATPPTITDEMNKDASKIPFWIDTSTTPHQLKQYSTTSAMWSPIATTYIKISAKGIEKGIENDIENEEKGIGEFFSVEDGVKISGIEAEGVTDLNGSTVIWAKGENYIVVKGFLEESPTQDKPIRIAREMPEMDFIIESGNRLWGCRYGPSGDGTVNEIYASKLGDFKNWNCFMGVSTDSYVATVGTDGQFTGAITHLGYPLFFKENCIHKVYGSYPANFQIQTTACKGVQEGSGKSLSIVNEVLYYKSRMGVCAYDGSLPVEISLALGAVNYHNAVAGTLGNKYYISMTDDSAQHHLFVYDTSKGMWHKEDNTDAADFCTCRGNLYYIDYADNQIRVVRGTGEGDVIESTPIEWQAITGIIGTDSPDKKYVSRMDVRMSINVGARTSFYVEYDSCGEWEYLFTMNGVKLQTFAVPIRPRRCDHMRLKILGSGEAKIFSICKTIEQGSDF